MFNYRSGKIRGFLVFETGSLIAKTYKKQFTKHDAKEMLVTTSTVEAIPLIL